MVNLSAITQDTPSPDEAWALAIEMVDALTLQFGDMGDPESLQSLARALVLLCGYSRAAELIGR